MNLFFLFDLHAHDEKIIQAILEFSFPERFGFPQRSCNHCNSHGSVLKDRETVADGILERKHATDAEIMSFKRDALR